VTVAAVPAEEPPLIGDERFGFVDRRSRVGMPISWAILEYAGAVMPSRMS